MARDVSSNCSNHKFKNSDCRRCEFVIFALFSDSFSSEWSSISCSLSNRGALQIDRALKKAAIELVAAHAISASVSLSATVFIRIRSVCLCESMRNLWAEIGRVEMRTKTRDISRLLFSDIYELVAIGVGFRAWAHFRGIHWSRGCDSSITYLMN